MPKLYVTKGIPGCGKSTLAKEMRNQNANLVEVNRDILRTQQPDFVPGKFSKKIEKAVKERRDFKVSRALECGADVISSDTNLTEDLAKHWEQMAKTWGAELIWIDFTDPKSQYYVPLETCIKRDLQRLESVGKDVILKMWYKTLKPQKQNEDLNEAVIVDLDGTLCHTNGRHPYEEKYDTDTCDEQVKFLIDTLYRAEVKIIILSGRQGTNLGRQQTLAWLETNKIPYDYFFMREANDNRCDSIVKREIYEAHIKDKFYVRFCVDDRKRVCREWEALGLKVFRVGPEYDFDLC